MAELNLHTATQTFLTSPSLMTQSLIDYLERVATFTELIKRIIGSVPASDPITLKTKFLSRQSCITPQRKQGNIR